jgi:hypothetical protein
LHFLRVRAVIVTGDPDDIVRLAAAMLIVRIVTVPVRCSVADAERWDDWYAYD